MFPYLERGYWPYEFRSQGYAWIFYVNEQRGLCNYRMSLRLAISDKPLVEVVISVATAQVKQISHA